MDIEIHTPITEEVAAGLQIGDTITITGYILCGRDAVLPRVVEMVKESSIEPLSKAGIKLHLGKGAIRKETVEALNSIMLFMQLFHP